MAQARIIRTKFQDYLLYDWIVMGDFNSSETDPSIKPIKDYKFTVAKAFEVAVPSSQRTFICDTLRCMDVRVPDYSMNTWYHNHSPINLS